MKAQIGAVAKSVPHDVIEGMENSSELQTSTEYLFRLFRNVMKEPTGFLNKYNDSTLTFDDANRRVSIAPKSGSFDVFIRGKVFTISTTLSYDITDSEGIWFFYFNSVGAFVGSQTPWILTDAVAPAATGYWDSTNKKFIRKNEERHGLSMDSDTHRLMHRTEGSKIDNTYPLGLQITNYIENGDGSQNAHAQYGVTDGTFFDEDIDIFIKHAASPANPYEQILFPTCKIPVFYLNGVDNWRKKDATFYPFYENVGSLPYFNQLSGGNWSLAPVTTGWFFATWHVYTDDIFEPVIALLGQRQDDNLISAVNNNTRANIILPRKFSEEMVFFKKAIWEVSTSFTNTPKCRLRYIATQTEVNAANDRWTAICNYNGNAGTGKFLEFYAGQSSDTSPFPIPEPSYIKTFVLSAVAASTGTVAIYKDTDLVNPIITASLSNSTYVRVNAAVVLYPDEKLVAKVSSGSINKPAVTLFIQTNL